MSWFDFWQRQKFFPFSNHPDRLYPKGTVAFPGGKATDAWSWPLSPPRNEVNNEWNYTSILSYAFAACAGAMLRLLLVTSVQYFIPYFINPEVLLFAGVCVGVVVGVHPVITCFTVYVIVYESIKPYWTMYRDGLMVCPPLLLYSIMVRMRITFETSIPFSGDFLIHL